MKPKDLPVFRDVDAKKVLKAACARHGITFELLQNLLEAQRDYAGAGRAVGISEKFEGHLTDHIAELRGD
jgi:hypothetical protein